MHTVTSSVEKLSPDFALLAKRFSLLSLYIAVFTLAKYTAKNVCDYSSPLRGVYTSNKTVIACCRCWQWQFEKVGNFLLKTPDLNRLCTRTFNP